jgi:iron-sulfur cluster assembly accessory protein
MISFTDKAIEQLKTVIEAPECVRVAVVGGGCAGMSYMMDIVTDGDEDDILINFDHVKIYVDPHSADILSKTTVDFVKTLQKEGFVFNNPESNTTCGCGLSFS